MKILKDERLSSWAIAIIVMSGFFFAFILSKKIIAISVLMLYVAWALFGFFQFKKKKFAIDILVPILSLLVLYFQKPGSGTWIFIIIWALIFGWMFLMEPLSNRIFKK